MLFRVSQRLSALFAQQARDGNYVTSEEVDLLFQLHSLLVLTRDGRLCRRDWNLKKYREALPYLWLPLVPPHQRPVA